MKRFLIMIQSKKSIINSLAPNDGFLVKIEISRDRVTRKENYLERRESFAIFCFQ